MTLPRTIPLGGVVEEVEAEHLNEELEVGEDEEPEVEHMLAD